MGIVQAPDMASRGGASPTSKTTLSGHKATGVTLQTENSGRKATILPRKATVFDQNAEFRLWTV